eukprot:TRINITY_DN5490_c0_g1_i1.p1 TRINITY_DN5490_c0_g1~~TRINITY_DN5490_c0_g1_i1.p1  ORF type:complete len:213 (-),score=35.92 TRINITY_DN5490_c0_g1_i1:44-682(-)
MDWPQFLFQDLQIRRVENPRGLRDMTPPEPHDATKVSDELNIIFPEDYLTFSSSLGPGVLGRIRIYCPMPLINFADLRTHAGRFTAMVEKEDYQTVHKFPMEQLVIFAQDIHDNLWFAWRRDYGNNGNHCIYCFDENPEADPPKKVADDFREFVINICLGKGYRKLNLRRFDLDNYEVSEESWSSSESSQEENDADPPKTFRSHPVKIINLF